MDETGSNGDFTHDEDVNSPLYKTTDKLNMMPEGGNNNPMG